MKIEKIIVDTNQYNGKYDMANVIVDCELREGEHYVYNFNAKADYECGDKHPGKKHLESCFSVAIEKKVGEITGKLVLYEHKMMSKLKE